MFDEECAPRNDDFFKPKEFSKEIIKSIYATRPPNRDFREISTPINNEKHLPSMKVLLQKMARMTRSFYPKHTLMERDIARLQQETSVSRYEIYNLFSAHSALLKDYREAGVFEWESFKQGLAMILRVRSDFIERVMMKCLGEIEQPSERVF